MTETFKEKLREAAKKVSPIVVRPTFFSGFRDSKKFYFLSGPAFTQLLTIQNNGRDCLDIR